MKSPHLKASINFTYALPLEHDYLYISGSLQDLPANSDDSRLMIYDKQNLYLWSKHDVPWKVICLALANDASEKDDCPLLALSNEGHVEFLYFDTDPVIEKIPDAGVFSEDAACWGYMSHLRQIGEHLYACGDGGQVYRRHGPDDWRHIDAGLLQTPPITDRLQLNCIHGLTEDDIYLAGDFPGPTGLEGRLFHFDGSAWRPLTIPPVGYLNAIHIESTERIWVCGRNGALLLGNARDGFRSPTHIEDNQLFYSLTLFNGLLYLASNLGLFSYDPAHPDAGLREVVTGLTPELQDAHIVDACDGVLWSIGFKDIARFDGTRWERIHHPDNPRIGP